jgi:hypothetical protein
MTLLRQDRANLRGLRSEGSSIVSPSTIHRSKRRLKFSVTIALLLFSIFLPRSSQAQVFQCPSGTTQSQSGYVIECRCPDGSLAGYQGCASQSSVPQSICPAGTAYCADSGACCGSGLYCSHYGCTPIGAVECGNHYCSPGQQCSRSGGCQPAGTVDCGPYYCQFGQRCASGHAACLSQTDTDCGSYHCSSGSKCSSGGCISQSATDCGNKTFCNNGLKCSRNGKSCLTQDAVDCGSHSCAAGMKCGTNNQCLSRDAVDCGGGRSCPAGNVCLQGGAECISPANLAARVEAEKQRKIAEAEARKREAVAKAALDKQLKQQAIVEKKEDREITDWLKKEQARVKTAAQQSTAAKVSGSSVPKSPDATAAKPPANAQTPTVVTIIPGNQSAANTTAAQAETAHASPAQSRPAEIGKPAEVGSSTEIGKPATVGVPVTIASPVPIGTVTTAGTSQIQTVAIPIANASKTNATASPWTSASLANAGTENHAYSFATGTGGMVQVSDQGKPVAITTSTLATLQYGSL